ncbi:TonB-dependent receptor [Allosphingosinicella vermicomposti]|uniref:TonB-dependent receptor n=1 Tax=Allosphingosinicella vermicomposti TaxID=614671 RepID=UPI00315A42B1
MMRSFAARSLSHIIFGVSTLAIAAPAMAQDAAATVGQPGDSEIQETAPGADDSEDIVVTGIRASLREAVDIKRDAQGVVDAISAEDIGKFPDTNLAESLQRITGVSIDRSNGEGSTVTVRGFGPEFNLVTLNGRQMPTASLGDGMSPPSSRSFDFGNLASEGISAVEVYKTGRASVASGGIGSTINIRTPRPLDNAGLKGSVAVKGVYDTSRNEGNPITPEISGIVSNTFADDRIGVAISGSYQRRKASVNNAQIDWLDGRFGGTAPLTNEGAVVTNAPGPDDVYEIPQNAAYSVNDIDRERINGQAVFQAELIDSLTATLDYTYSRNRVESRSSSVGMWFNNAVTVSEWTDGPVAGPLFYSELIAGGSDLSYGGSLTANQTENKSLGANLTWEAPGGVTMALDYHNSSAESKPTNKYGTSTHIGTAVFNILSKSFDTRDYLPVLSYTTAPGVDALDASLVTPTGNSFRNAYFKNDIDQIQLKGRYDHEGSFLSSIDFGASYIESSVRSAYGFIQQDTWGGAGPPSDIPDDIFSVVTLPDKFKGMGGAGNPDMIPALLSFDFERMVDLLGGLYNTCGGDGDCLAPYTVDRRITEKTLAPYVQVNGQFDAFTRPANVIAGLRYENTSIKSSALVPIPNGTRWVADGEIVLTYSGESDFTTFKGEYSHWLPSIDFDIEPMENLKLRASYSHTITRADYGSLQGGLTINQQFGREFGGGSRGNPGLLPYKSKNIDLSAEYYYQPDSYVSVGYFHKSVENFIGQSRVDGPAFDLRNPASGPRYRAAVAALGATATAGELRDYIFINYTSTTRPVYNSDGTFALNANGNIRGEILSQPEDDLVNFQVSTPVNNDQTAKLYGWEVALQHTFWETGFGVILNYTKVDGDATYDNTQPATVTQFALTGLSDSANAVAFYDKNGIQARVAYNWRDKFLASSGPNPLYVQSYGQIDLSASYEFLPGLTGFVEGINILGDDRRGHRRSEHNVVFATQGDARYAAGVRFNF